MDLLYVSLPHSLILSSGTTCDCDSKVGVRECVMWNIMCGSKTVCVHMKMYYVDWGEREECLLSH